MAQWQLAAPPRGGCVVTPTEAGTNKHRVRFGAGGRDGRRPAAETTNRKFVGSRAIIPPTPRRSRKFGPSRRREVGRERGENSTATLNRRTIHSHDRLDPIFLSLVEGGERFSSVARVCVYPLNGRAVNS